MKPRITDLSLAELAELIRSYGQPDYRARQVFRWLYCNLVTTFDQMTDLPAGFREKLAAETTLLSLGSIDKVIAADRKTVKVLFQLEDGNTIESVLMLTEEYGEGRKRNTVCVSSQVGCQIRCPFCATGQQGFERNLSSGEIVEQVLHFQRELGNHHYDDIIGDTAPPNLTNIVYMGMGEPLANYDAVKKSLQTLMAKEGMGFGARRITISTCGLAPEIKRLADEPFHVELAVSLHAPNDIVRNKLVPINRKYSLAVLLAAVKEFFDKTGRRPTFEYTLFRDVNDSVEQARELVRLLRGLNCHVNLIMPSPTDRKDFEPPDLKQVRAFQDELTHRGISNTTRFSRGLEIGAACGQLRARKSG